MTTHELKIWPQFFQPVWEGAKLFELRKRDRDYKVGDQLCLREWNSLDQQYTGREVTVGVTYLTDYEHVCALSPVALGRDYVILSFEVLDQSAGPGR